MKASVLGSFNSLFGFGNLNIFWKTSGLKLMGGTIPSPTQIILLVGSKRFHKTNPVTLKSYGMHPTFIKPITLRCLEDVSFAGKSKYQ